MADLELTRSISNRIRDSQRKLEHILSDLICSPQITGTLVTDESVKKGM